MAEKILSGRKISEEERIRRKFGCTGECFLCNRIKKLSYLPAGKGNSFKYICAGCKSLVNMSEKFGVSVESITEARDHFGDFCFVCNKTGSHGHNNVYPYVAEGTIIGFLCFECKTIMGKVKDLGMAERIRKLMITRESLL